MEKLYFHIACAIDSFQRCTSPSANESQRSWAPRWRDRLDLMQQQLPRGSGFDDYPGFDLEVSGGEKIKIVGSYHRMDENGYYDGWTNYTVTVTPSLIHGFKLRITGGNADFKDYAHECFSHALHAVFDTAAFEPS